MEQAQYWLHSFWAFQSWAQDAEPKFNSNVDDLTKIRGVLKESVRISQTATNPPNEACAEPRCALSSHEEEIDSARKYNAQFDGIGPSQLDGFAKVLATSKDERFRNMEIRQDGPLGLVILITILSSTTRFTILASKSGRCAKLMGNGRSVRCLDDLLTVTADSQQRSREQGEHPPDGCAAEESEVKSVKSGTDGNDPN